MTYSDARKMCQDYGATLVTITNRCALHGTGREVPLSTLTNKAVPCRARHLILFVSGDGAEATLGKLAPCCVNVDLG